MVVALRVPVAVVAGFTLLLGGVGPATPEDLFADVTAAVGLDFVHFNGMTGRFYMPENMGAGGALVDYDNDGWIDLYLTRFGANLLLRNRGDSTFEDVTRAAGLDTVSGRGLGAVVLDADGDGWPDLYVANDRTPNQLWRNRGGRHLLRRCSRRRGG